MVKPMVQGRAAQATNRSLTYEREKSRAAVPYILLLSARLSLVDAFSHFTDCQDNFPSHAFCWVFSSFSRAHTFSYTPGFMVIIITKKTFH